MKTFILPYSDTEIKINDENIITSINGFDSINQIVEMKLSDYIVNELEVGSIYFTKYWLEMLIKEISFSLPKNDIEFEDLVRENWDQWATEDILIGNQISYYQFGDKYMAHDMIDYYGKRPDFGDLFQRRYDFVVPDIEIRIKE